MFAGHVGAALAIGRLERRVNLGVLIAAALFLDLVLWLLVLLGGETVTIPADFIATHQPAFVFPYSHGLLAAAAWSALAGVATLLCHLPRGGSKQRAAIWVASAVFSHWLLDALVHAPELPLTGANSARVGLGLWQDMPAALMVEGCITVAGLALFLTAATLGRSRKIGLAVLTLLTLVFTLVGMTVAPPPPSVAAMAVSSLLTIVFVSLLAGWLARGPR